MSNNDTLAVGAAADAPSTAVPATTPHSRRRLWLRIEEQEQRAQSQGDSEEEKDGGEIKRGRRDVIRKGQIQVTSSDFDHEPRLKAKAKH